MSGWREKDQISAHPGAVCLAMETIMGMGALYLTKQSALSKSFSIDYFGHTPIGEELLAESEIVMKRGEEEVVMESTLLDAKGNIFAKGKATFNLHSIDKLRNMAMCNPRDIDQLEKLISTF